MKQRRKNKEEKKLQSFFLLGEAEWAGLSALHKNVCNNALLLTYECSKVFRKRGVARVLVAVDTTVTGSGTAGI